VQRVAGYGVTVPITLPRRVVRRPSKTPARHGERMASLGTGRARSADRGEDDALAPGHGLLSSTATEGKDCMKLIVIMGVVFMVLGLAALVSQGFSYTTREKVLEVGPVQGTAEQELPSGFPHSLALWR